MKTKYLFTPLILGTVFFTLGFHSYKTNTENKPEAAIIIAQKAQTKTDYAKVLKGKYVLTGANYAGYKFIDAKTISWTNEMFPMDPDTLSLKWIDENTFMTKSRKRTNKNCAPAVSILKVISYSNGKLVLKDYWTGWNDRKDELNTFHQSKD